MFPPCSTRRLLLLLFMISTTLRCVHSIALLECGQLYYCAVHSNCYKPEATEYSINGWMPYVVDGVPRAHKDIFIPTCKRFIIMRMNPGAGSIRVHIKHGTIDATSGLKMWFTSYDNAYIHCKSGGAVIGGAPAFTVDNSAAYNQERNRETDNNGGTTFCLFDLKTTTSSSKPKELFDQFRNKANRFFITAGTESSKPTNVAWVEILTTLYRGMCSKEELKPVIQLANGDNNEMNAVLNSRHGLAKEYSTFTREEGDGTLDDQYFTCPPTYAMQYRPDTSRDWKYLQYGLACRYGHLYQLEHLSITTRVMPKHEVKCVRKKCAMCDACPSCARNDTVLALPFFNYSQTGLACHSMQCSMYMLVKFKNDKKIHVHRNSNGEDKRTNLQCSSQSGSQQKYWDYEVGGYRELEDAKCALEVPCMEWHPIKRDNCDVGEGKKCKEPHLSNTGDSSNICSSTENDKYILRYEAPDGNKRDLVQILCSTSDGTWKAVDTKNVHFITEDNAKLTCYRKEDDDGREMAEKERRRQSPPFVGSVGFYLVILAAIIIIAAIITGGVAYCRVLAKKKAAKRKDMDSVSVTMQEYRKPDKKKKKKSMEEKIDSGPLIKSVMTSTTTGTGASSDGSVPIAPPSLLTPVSVGKPDKGIAVLNLQTGKSKNMSWASKDDPAPKSKSKNSKNFPSFDAANRSSGKQIDVEMEEKPANVKPADGRLKFGADESISQSQAPEEEGDTVRNPQKKKDEEGDTVRYPLKKKRQSFQDPNEYNLGGPRPVKNDPPKRVESAPMSESNQDEPSKIVVDDENDPRKAWRKYKDN